ncbi:hypothetical protein MP228_003259 [Amoeboaphelidium protococcarum]|nr:hypothetical protein MP228_003259 [Amoeboaphelidium protococcarum]
MSGPGQQQDKKESTQQMSDKFGQMNVGNDDKSSKGSATNQQQQSSSTFGASLFGKGFNLDAPSFVPNAGAPSFFPSAGAGADFGAGYGYGGGMDQYGYGGGAQDYAAPSQAFQMTSDSSSYGKQQQQPAGSVDSQKPAPTTTTAAPTSGGTTNYAAQLKSGKRFVLSLGSTSKSKAGDKKAPTSADKKDSAASAAAAKADTKQDGKSGASDSKSNSANNSTSAVNGSQELVVAEPEVIELVMPKMPELTAEELAHEETFYQTGGKEHVNIVFIGHVDAGKSTMGGHILLQTGMVDKRTMEKYAKEAKEQNRESWFLSWALDLDDKERAKGITIETGRAFFETDKRRYTILDAPGHKNYVPSMITGASQADVGILVISARKGEFETGFEKGGQTREHALLASNAGLKNLIVAINKMDDSTVNWSKERFQECIDKLTPYLTQVGYDVSQDVKFIPLSGFTGANLKDRAGKDVCPWYDGPSLLEQLDGMAAVERKNDQPFMMPIAERWKDMGNLIVTGKVESGRVRIGKEAVIMPLKKICEVLTIQNEAEEEVKGVVSGDNAKIKIRGIDEDEVQPGFVLCSPWASVKTVTRFEVELTILDVTGIVCPGFRSMLHVHTAVQEVILGQFMYLVDPKTRRKSKKPPMFVKNGQVLVCKMEALLPICLETFEDHPQLGRFTLRDEGKTIAMGKVLKLLDPSIYIPADASTVTANSNAPATQGAKKD